MTEPDRTPWWAEAPLVLVHLAVVAGFVRVYDGAFFWPLAAFVLVGHALAIGARRGRAPAPVALVVAAVGLALTATWALFPATACFGLPTGATVDAARAALQDAADAFPQVVAPTAVLPGFQLAAGVALWIAAWFADWTAHRLHATAEPVTTGAAVFTFCAVLGSGRDVELSTALFGGAVLLFVVTQRAAATEREHAWMQARPAVVRSVAARCLVLGGLALGIGLVVGPLLPGAGDDPAVDWRGGDDGPSSRVTISPMVELKKRLVEQSDELLFEVRAEEASYWRLTSLDRFDGEIWSSSGDYGPAERRLPTDGEPRRTSRALEQQIRIRALATIWVPAAFEPIGVLDADEELRWDADSATLIVDESQKSSDGLTYRVLSQLPTLTAGDLTAARGPDDPAVDERYGSLPATFPASVAATAREVAAVADDRYGQALALQDWFRSEFTYSLDSPEGHGDDALTAFLQSRTGYCEQFAGAYAAMARALGMPSRVAVGFTPGTVDPDDPSRRLVLGRHAHAWPEVWFPEVGWVPFEPTPGRGLAGAEDYTLVAPAQDRGGPVDPEATTTTSRPAATTSTTAAAGDPTADDDARTRTTSAPSADAEPDGGTDRGPSGSVVLVGMGVVAALLLLGAGVHRRRRHRSAPLDPVDAAWARAARALGRSDPRALDLSATPLEVARLAHGSDVGPAIEELAQLVTASRWSGEPPTPHEVARAAELAAAVEAGAAQVGAGPSSVLSSVGRER